MGKKLWNNYAVLVTGKDDKYCGFDGAGRLVKSILRQYNIISLIKNYTKDDIKQAIMNVADMQNKNSTLVFFIAGHGGAYGFYTDDGYLPHKVLKEWLDNWISNKQLIVGSSCGAGGIIIPGKDETTLAASHRLIITSSFEDGGSVCGKPYSPWVNKIFNEGVKVGLSIQEAQVKAFGGLPMEALDGYVILDGYGSPFYL